MGNKIVTTNEKLFVQYNGTWRSYMNPSTRKYEGPEIRGSVLAYSSQTHPVASKRVPVDTKAKIRNGRHA